MKPQVIIRLRQLATCLLLLRQAMRLVQAGRRGQAAIRGFYLNVRDQIVPRYRRVSAGMSFTHSPRREPYANIEPPKAAQMIPNRPKTTSILLLLLQTHPLISNRLGNPVGGPEKAGVGGSIPSLATI